ncbi:diguanylate cyclase [Aliivibrio fischeri]|uniref:diguanylate cyclase domain-containing protein n=1 Tax=Aliivibrio fischeri TaxID=668 RepID=UPI0012D8F1BA|nr:diguanylate cyclase [Aliivibrio fischeri]MUH97542.1 diguanylate cyclase [Aliivibrio fischeri]MUI62273.1 diguanylate cyclase [Aliivibrio fischeri]
MKAKLFFTKRISIITFICCCFFIVTWVIEELHQKQNNFLHNQISNKAKVELAKARSDLESAIYSDIYYANSLATLLTVNPESTLKQWDPIAQELYRDSQYIRHLAIAPNDVVKYLYPLKGNERAIDLDLRSIPIQWITVQKARNNESIFIAGPVELFQGGKAFIARMPVFLDPPFNTQYWGSISIVLNIDALFYGTGVYQLKVKYPFAMRGKDSQGEFGELFLGKESVFDDPIAVEKVALPYGSWQLAIQKQSLEMWYPWYRIQIVRLVGYAFFGLGVFALVIIFRLYVMAINSSLEDELTHLPNRRYFMYTLNTLFMKAKKKNKSFVLVNLDLNKFKRINDTYGHAAGDAVLKDVATRIVSLLRSNDVVARVGGDEFLILLPRVHKKDDIELIMEKIEMCISSSPVKFKEWEIRVETSIGYALYLEEMKSPDELLHQADQNMYLNKHNDQ